MEDIKIERIRLEDGRHAERHVKTGENERVVELHCEPERPLLLSQRLIEKTKPVVVERTVETIKDGEVVDRKIESLDPHVKMELRSHISKVKTLAQKAADDARHADPNAKVTRDELRDAILAAVKAVKADTPEFVEEPQPVRKFAAAPRVFKAEQEVANRVDALEKPSWKTVGLWAIVVAQAAGLGYLLFMM